MSPSVDYLESAGGRIDGACEGDYCLPRFLRRHQCEGQIPAIDLEPTRTTQAAPELRRTRHLVRQGTSAVGTYAIMQCSLGVMSEQQNGAMMCCLQPPKPAASSPSTPHILQHLV